VFSANTFAFYLVTFAFLILPFAFFRILFETPREAFSYSAGEWSAPYLKAER
jgi:hypothetical protein